MAVSDVDPAADPFRVLGLPPDADAEAVRRARRDLAKRHHPDAGGDADEMRRVNTAAAAALRRLASPPNTPAPAPSSPAPSPSAPSPSVHREPGPVRRDTPSFVVEALPAEAFEALLLVAAELGEVVDDDPPYALDVRLVDPVRGWCRLDVVPDAGSSTVGLAVAADEGRPPPSLLEVRNLWIDRLNRLDWADL